MNKPKHYEGPGAISKRETLSSADYRKENNILAIESHHPFPGYHGEELPYNDCPISLFLATKKRYLSEEIMRVSQCIAKHFPHTFDAAPAVVQAYNERTYSIRVKDIKYEHIDDLVQAYKENDILFLRGSNLKPYSSIIKVKKFFTIEEIAPNIFKDLDWEGMYYLKIDDQLRWDPFEDMTIDLKNNMEDNNFDAATAMVYTRDGLFDFIRIYDQNTNAKKLQDIHNKYLSAIKRHQFI